MDEYFIMDDGGNRAVEQLTSEMLANYEAVKKQLEDEFKEALK